VRAHVFLCMLACHVEWHMRERLKPILFDESQIRRLSTSMSRIRTDVLPRSIKPWRCQF
jgi:hypothetical protein